MGLIFDTKFEVKASLPEVAAFHKDTRALKKLTMPPILVQIHQVEPLQEGSMSSFTLWLGFVPIHWQARHSQVDALHGFTDIQVRGPLEKWEHSHRFKALQPGRVEIHEHIEFEHRQGWRGWLTRLLFNPLGLRVMFSYRAWITRRSLENA